ncbi:MAG: serine/threonine-protein kinase [Burkholderiaceae bacterium]
MNVPDPQRWAMLSPLLDELLELPADARPARLALLRAQDAGLAEELEALLAGPDSTRGGRFMAGTALREAPSLAGQRLGAYTLEAPLGQGGTGTVWRARRDDGRFEGAVAIKLLHLSLIGQAGAERFSREGNILARLTHPNIARLLDAGLTDAGQPYLVIELVRGERLDRHCDAQGLGVDQRLALFGDVLAAVAHAHSHLVIHRDIKPSNIMVTPEGVVKLLDFGIAKLVEDEGALADSTDLTREWGRALTPEYAAPEQLRGEAVTTATDVYALGVLLYELLSGRLPYPGRRRSATGTLAPLPEAAPVRPSLAVADPVRRRRLAGDLDTITLRAMKPEAAERYPTVSAMRDDLARHLSGHPVLARADSWAYRARKFVGRNRAGCAVAAGVALALLGGAHAQVAVLLALAAGTLVALWQARAARAQAGVAREAQRRAEAVKQFIGSIFTEATPREGEGGVVSAADLLTSATGRIEAELAANPAVAGELGVLIAQSCSKLGELTLGRRAVEAALPRCHQAFGARHELTLRGRVLQLEALNQNSLHDEAQRLVAPLLADLRGALPAQVEVFVEALRATSYLMAKLQDDVASFAALQEAIAVSEAHLGPSHEETLYTLGLLSNTFKHFGRYPESLAAATTAVERAWQTLGTARPNTLLTSLERWYADALVGTGRPAQAEVVARQVVIDQKALDSTVTGRVVNAMTAHSLALAGMGRITEAVALAREVVAQHARLFETQTVDTAHFAYRLAQCLLPTRRLDEIEAALARDESLWPVLGGEAVFVRLRRQRLRALLGAWRGDAEAAQGLIDAADEPMRTDAPVEWARLARARAVNLRLHQRWVEAIAAAHDAIARSDAPGALAVDRAHAHTELGLALLGHGDAAGADTQITLAEQQFDFAEIVPESVLRSDVLLARGRLHLMAGRAGDAKGCFERAERGWAEVNPGSVWHLEAQQALAESQRASPDT